MRRLVTTGSAVKRLKRFRQVINVFVRYGFGEAMGRIRVWEACNVRRHVLRRKAECSIELTTPQRLASALEELGPTFIKIGQLLSTRPDLVPPKYIVELKRLRAGAHLVPAHVIRGIVESELGRPIDEIFESFDDTPLAAASLAQVHRATFRGKQVVLKVQRPDIVEVTEVDMDILQSVAHLAERYSHQVYLFNVLGLVEEFAQQIRKELDFRMEVNNMRRFSENFAGDATVHIPEFYPELCTHRVITMEYLDGINISEIQRLSDEGYDLQEIARRGVDIGFKTIFQHGFFHADPHPGNIFVLPGNVIGLIDFGMMATLSLRDRESFAKLVHAISTRDERRVARALTGLTEHEEVTPAEELEPAISNIITDYGGRFARELYLAGMLFAMMQAVMKREGRLRSQLIWATKTIAIAEEIGQSLSADFDIMEVGKPYAWKLLTQKLNPLRQTNELYYWFIDAMSIVRDLPYDVGIVLQQVRKGRLKVEFEHVGLEPIRRTLDRVAHRIPLTILIAALLLSSSVLVLAQVPPFVGGIPLLALIGYIIAGILGFILAIYMIRRL
jgi:ubiquinone biosynthesis protein